MTRWPSYCIRAFCKLVISFSPKIQIHPRYATCNEINFSFNSQVEAIKLNDLYIATSKLIKLNSICLAFVLKMFFSMVIIQDRRLHRQIRNLLLFRTQGTDKSIICLKWYQCFAQQAFFEQLLELWILPCLYIVHVLPWGIDFRSLSLAEKGLWQTITTSLVDSFINQLQYFLAF